MKWIFAGAAFVAAFIFSISSAAIKAAGKGMEQFYDY